MLPETSKHAVAAFDLLNLWYFGDAPRRLQPEVAPDERVAGFGEVLGGLSAGEASYEAARCLSCGNCFECDGCLGACPEDAVIKLGVGHRYRFDYERCTGCAACFEQCPVHAIDMVPEGAGDMVPEGAGDMVPEGAGDMVPEGAGDMVPEGAGDMVPEGTIGMASEGG